MELSSGLWKVAADIIIDALRLLPFLFVTYVIMEYIEHKAGDKAEIMIQKAGKCGPLIGGVLGIVPQCGFSAAAANLYAGGIITLGTLFAVFLSTSDEMLPIFISEQVPVLTILKILLVKALVGVIAGFILDGVMRKRKDGKESHGHLRIEEMCDHQNCHCNEGKIWKSAMKHTLQIVLFIIITSFLITILIGIVGEEGISSLLNGQLVLGPAIAGVIGLLPNCASSVILTRLYLSGVLGVGSMIAGLLAGSGVGLLVLFRINKDLKENLKILLLLYGTGVIAGIFIEAAGFVF